MEEFYSESYALVEQGLSYDEIGDFPNAIAMYLRALELIDIASQMPADEHREMSRKMCDARARVEQRLATIRSGGGDRTEKVKRNGEGTAEEQVAGIREAFESAVVADEVDEIFMIPDGVQVFIIEGEETTVPTYPEPLKIFRFRHQKTAATADGVPTAEAFIQVGTWAYPLYRGRSPVLHSDFGAYIFPNPTADHPNMFVGVLLPNDIDKQLLDKFEQFLKQYTDMREQDICRQLSAEEQKLLSHKIAAFLVKSGETIAWGVKEGAERTSKLVSKQAERYRSKEALDAANSANISPAVRHSIHYVYRGSKVAVKVTRYLLDKIGEVGVYLGTQMVKGTDKHLGEKGLVAGTMTVLGGGIVGASTVWIALENAGRALGRSIANETVHIVHHRYGESASSTTHDALYAAGNSALAAYQLYDFGPRAIAGRAARHAGVQIIKDLSGNKPTASTSVKQ